MGLGKIVVDGSMPGDGLALVVEEMLGVGVSLVNGWVLDVGMATFDDGAPCVRIDSVVVWLLVFIGEISAPGLPLLRAAMVGIGCCLWSGLEMGAELTIVVILLFVK